MRFAFFFATPCVSMYAIGMQHNVCLFDFGEEVENHADNFINPSSGRGYVATLTTCGLRLILPLALKRWGPPGRQGLCSHLAHLWATSDSAPRSKAVGTPQAVGVM